MHTVYLAALVALGLLYTAEGYPKFQARIPNGGRIMNPCGEGKDATWQGVGHTNPEGGGPLNQFGTDFMNAGFEWTEELCRMDSDGDGRTNGEELGDPDCVWQPLSDEELAQQGDINSADAALRSSTLQHMADAMQDSRIVKRDLDAQLGHPGICEPVHSEQCQAANVDIEGCSSLSDDRSLGDCDALSSSDSDIRSVELRFPLTNVPSADTSYYCRTFRAPEQSPNSIIAIENVFDNRNVVHHMILFACNHDSYPEGQFDQLHPCGLINDFCPSMVYAWKIGVGDRCLSDTSGIPFGEGGYNTFVLQMHWNNPDMVSDYTDSSGLRLYYTPTLRPNSEQVALFMQAEIDVPPMSEEHVVTSVCNPRCLTHTMYITTMFLHMHKLGKSGTVELYKNGVFHRTLVQEDDYLDTKPQLFTFSPPLAIYPGEDEIRVTCIYNSLEGNKRREHSVQGGYRATEEMCIAFTTYYPSQEPAFSCIQYGNDMAPCDDNRMHKQYRVFPALPLLISQEEEEEEDIDDVDSSHGNHHDHSHHGNRIQGFHMSREQREELFLELFNLKTKR